MISKEHWHPLSPRVHEGVKIKIQPLHLNKIALIPEYEVLFGWQFDVCGRSLRSTTPRRREIPITSVNKKIRDKIN